MYARMINRFSSWFDGALSGSVMRQFLLLFAFFVFLYLFWLSMAYIFIPNNTGQINKDIPEPGWSIIAQMIDPGNQHQVGTPDEEAAKDPVHWKVRFFVLFLSLSGTFAFGGLLISTITNVFEQRVSMVREGVVNYHFSGHTVILGYHDITKGLVQQFLRHQKKDPGKIVILAEGNIPEIRKTLKSEIPKPQFRSIYLLAGKRTTPHDLIRCGVSRASAIYIPGGQHETDHDPKNNACLQEINKIVHQSTLKKQRNIPCHVLFDAQTTHLLYQFGNIKLGDNPEIAAAINILSFNFEELWARKVFLDDQTPPLYPPLDFEPIETGSDQYVHLIVAGMTRMGFALAVQAARMAHFANHDRQKTRITFIDAEAERERDFFATRYQSFYDAVDVESTDLFTGTTTHQQGSLPFVNIGLRFVKGRFESPETRRLLMQWTADPNALTTLVLTFHDPAVNMAAALYLPAELYNRNIRILVKQDTRHSVVSLLIPDGKAANNKYRHVKAFGMLDDCPGVVSPDHLKARMVNHFYNSGYEFPAHVTDEILKVMQRQWDGLAERHKWSSRNNAESIPVKLRAIGASKLPADQLQEVLDPQTIDFLARMEHARWNVDALLSGYSPPPDEVKASSTKTSDAITEAIAAGESNEMVEKIKEVHDDYVKIFKMSMIHPCLIPYSELSEYYKDIDRRLVKSIPVIEKIHAQQTKIN
jgi:hypothetical protein